MPKAASPLEDLMSLPRGLHVYDFGVSIFNVFPRTGYRCRISNSPKKNNEQHFYLCIRAHNVERVATFTTRLKHGFGSSLELILFAAPLRWIGDTSRDMSLEEGSGERQLGIFRGLKKSRKHHVLKINSLFFLSRWI